MKRGGVTTCIQDAASVLFHVASVLCVWCDMVQVCPGLPERMLQVLDQFPVAGPLEDLGPLEALYDRLSCALRPWPQWLRDFAVSHSRQFLQQLGRNLGEDSPIYHQVVSVLQGSSAPTPKDMEKVNDDHQKCTRAAANLMPQ